MAINFGLLDTGLPERLGAMPANALAMRRQRLMQDEQMGQQREQAQMQNALARMQMGKAQRDMQREEALMAAASQGGDWDTTIENVRRIDPTRALDLETKVGALKKGSIEAQKAVTEQAWNKLERYRQHGLQSVRTPQQYASWLHQQHTDPELAPVMSMLPPLEESLRTIPSDPAQFEKFRQQGMLGMEKWLQMNKPMLRTLNLGGRDVTQAVDPNTGQVISEQSYGKTMSPGEIAADARSRASLAQSERQFQVQRGIEREKMDIERVKTATQQGAPAQKAADAREVLQLLDQAAPLIDQATGSYIGAGIDIVGRGAGISTQGAMAGSQLKAIEGLLVSKMPKMSGPQSDKDVLLYRQMAGQIGDETVPAAQKKAAMSAIRQINERYAGQQGASTGARAPSANARGWTLHTDANGNQAYVSPDGRQFEEVR